MGNAVKVRERGPAAFVVWCAAVVAAVAGAVAGAAYVLSPNVPFGFADNFASTLAGTAGLAASVKTLADLIDAIGWDALANRTAFAFSPMAIYAATVPLAKMFGGNAFAAVKAVQVAEVLLSWLTAAYLYRRLRGRTPWAVVAGALYALLPEQLLLVRTSLEAGMIGALTPLAVGASIALVRRWGVWALPLCGAIAGCASAQFDTGYAIYAGLPVYAFACAAGFDRKRPVLWAAASLFGVLCGIGTIAYVILPTLGSRDVFSPAASVVSFFSGDGTRAPFVLGALAFAVVPIEIVVWCLAGLWAALGVRARRRSAAEGALLVIGGACTVLSFAQSERFLMVAAAAAAVAAASVLEQLCSEAKWRAYAAVLATAVIAASLVTFVSIGVAQSQPLNARTLEWGGRAATLAWDVPALDWRLGALASPFLASQRDIAQRYAGDGLDGTGLLARANVTSIVAAEGATFAARSLEPERGYVTSTVPACFEGGPGLLDRVVAMPAFEHVTFFDDSFPCKHALFADSAPVERSLGGSTIESFAGDALFPQARKLIG
ncbi:MAG TPA: hypothetical protein VK760_12920, partial [Candidatus Acidoferrales bacterium]|nr:hypothetical protein [Candidatus Acidoferrales bacterium]